MKVAVYDTYVTKKDGTIMHFDILVPDHVKDERIIHGFGKHFLRRKVKEGQSLSSKECQYCHIEQATDKMLIDIIAKGYSIIEREGCKS